MVAATVFYTHEDKTKTFPMNTVFGTPTKKIKGPMIQNLQKRVANEFAPLLEVDPKDVINVVFYGFTYLGLMTPKEFADEPQIRNSH
jgi:hypothetical protein